MSFILCLVVILMVLLMYPQQWLVTVHPAQAVTKTSLTTFP